MSLLTHIQKYFMPSRDTKEPIRECPSTHPLTLGRWPLCRTLDLQLIFPEAASASSPRVAGSDGSVPCREGPTRQGFHQSTGKLCLKRLHTCLHRLDLSSWDPFFTALSASSPESRQWFIWVFFTFSLSLLEEALGHLEFGPWPPLPLFIKKHEHTPCS